MLETCWFDLIFQDSPQCGQRWWWWWSCTVLLFKPTIPLLGVWFSWCKWPWQFAPVLQLYHHHHEQDGHGHAGGGVWCWKTTGQGMCASSSPSQQNQTTPIITNFYLLPVFTTWSCPHTESSSGDPSIHHQGWDDRCWGSGSEAGRQRDSHKGAQEVSQDQGNTNELPNSPPKKKTLSGSLEKEWRALDIFQKPLTHRDLTSES